jgi:hypothetical protein
MPPLAAVSIRKLLTGRMTSTGAAGGGSLQPLSVTQIRTDPIRACRDLNMLFSLPVSQYSCIF